MPLGTTRLQRAEATRPPHHPLARKAGLHARGLYQRGAEYEDRTRLIPIDSRTSTPVDSLGIESRAGFGARVVSSIVNMVVSDAAARDP